MWSYEGLYDVIDYRVVDEVTNGSSREAQGADGADASSSKQSDQQAGDVASTAQGTKKVPARRKFASSPCWPSALPPVPAWRPA